KDLYSYIRTKCPKTYTIGPLDAILKSKLESKTTLLLFRSPNSLFEVNKSCMVWLDAQPLKYVIYVSFGSVIVMTKEELMEFWYGLVNSKKHFLWVIRPNLVIQKDGGKMVNHLKEERAKFFMKSTTEKVGLAKESVTKGGLSYLYMVNEHDYNQIKDLYSYIRTKCPKTYTIGPLDAILKSKLESKTTLLLFRSPNSLFEVNKSCMVWLDAQPLKYVIYVSFGSVIVMTKEELMEFWYGLVNSKEHFLWVIRPNLVIQKDGMDMKDVCDRAIGGKMVNHLKEERAKFFMKSTTEKVGLAKESVTKGGLSYCNLDHLIKDIWLMSMTTTKYN
ncbi:7-deoxyloganetic acid glucosyltransferase, partial [Quercus suber]